MLAWIKPLRLKVGLLSGLLTVAGLQVADVGNTPWVLPLAVLAATSAAMVQNDWRDRHHDAHKGKALASSRPAQFFIFTVAVWTAVVALTAAVSIQNWKFGALLALMVFVGLLYSESRQIPLLPTLIVAVASASPVLFPVFAGQGTGEVWLIFLAAALAVFGREITKDIEDAEVDAGYKWTLPVYFGRQRAEALFVVTSGGAFLAVLSISLVLLFAAPLFALSGLALIGKGDPKAARRYLDIAFLLIVLWLIMSN